MKFRPESITEKRLDFPLLLLQHTDLSVEIFKDAEKVYSWYLDVLSTT